VKEASVDEIARVEGFGPKQAAAVHDFFHGPSAPAAEGPEVTESDIDAALAAEAETPS
jgi:excinuclease ABC subunit C